MEGKTIASIMKVPYPHVNFDCSYTHVVITFTDGTQLEIVSNKDTCDGTPYFEMFELDEA